MKIPAEILTVFEEESEGLLFGEVGLTLYLRDGQPRFEVTRKRSIHPKDIVLCEKKSEKAVYPR